MAKMRIRSTVDSRCMIKCMSCEQKDGFTGLLLTAIYFPVSALHYINLDPDRKIYNGNNLFRFHLLTSRSTVAVDCSRFRSIFLAVPRLLEIKNFCGVKITHVLTSHRDKRGRRLSRRLNIAKNVFILFLNLKRMHRWNESRQAVAQTNSSKTVASPVQASKPPLEGGGRRFPPGGSSQQRKKSPPPGGSHRNPAKVIQPSLMLLWISDLSK